MWKLLIITIYLNILISFLCKLESSTFINQSLSAESPLTSILCFVPAVDLPFMWPQHKTCHWVNDLSCLLNVKLTWPFSFVNCLYRKFLVGQI